MRCVFVAQGECLRVKLKFSTDRCLISICSRLKKTKNGTLWNLKDLKRKDLKDESKLKLKRTREPKRRRSLNKNRRKKKKIDSFKSKSKWKGLLEKEWKH